jgi:myo-inositol-1(or 4)-monophosphatase
MTLGSADLLETAVVAARDAAAVHAVHLGRIEVEQWSEKGFSDYVTHVDREAESRVLARIRERFPEHRILAEEAESDRSRDSGTPMHSLTGSGWTWIIDPLDGTTNYLHGYPVYAVSIAVAQQGRLEAGVVLNSATGDEWTARRGAGAFLNGRPISVSRIDDLARALLGTGFPFKALELLPRYLQQFAAALRGSSGIRRAGSAALDLCHVASGWFDGFWELGLAPWDVAAGTLIVREAGGVVSRIDGTADVLGHGSILAGNAVVHEKLGALIRRADDSAYGTGSPAA